MEAHEPNSYSILTQILRASSLIHILINPRSILNQYETMSLIPMSRLGYSFHLVIVSVRKLVGEAGQQLK